MSEMQASKLIAFPRPSLTAPLVMTAWGRLLEFESFDAELAKELIIVNQVLAPEYGAP
jgi:hypothetical protein